MSHFESWINNWRTDRSDITKAFSQLSTAIALSASLLVSPAQADNQQSTCGPYFKPESNWGQWMVDKFRHEFDDLEIQSTYTRKRRECLNRIHTLDPRTFLWEKHRLQINGSIYRESFPENSFVHFLKPLPWYKDWDNIKPSDRGYQNGTHEVLPFYTDRKFTWVTMESFYAGKITLHYGEGYNITFRTDSLEIVEVNWFQNIPPIFHTRTWH